MNKKLITQQAQKYLEGIDKQAEEGANIDYIVEYNTIQPSANVQLTYKGASVVIQQTKETINGRHITKAIKLVKFLGDKEVEVEEVEQED